MPITWQSIRSGYDATAASRPLEISRQNIDAGFDAFSNILKQREAIDVANGQASQEAAKQNFLDQLALAKTPEQLAAMQQAGQIDAAKAALGVQARAAVRGAEEARLTGLRQAVTAEQGYNDTQLDRQSMPIRNNIAELVAAGRYSEARESLDSSTTIRDKAPILAQIAAAERLKITQDFEDAKRAHEKALQPGAVKLQTAQINTAEAQADALKAQAEATRHGVKAADVAAERLAMERLDAARKRFIDNSPMAYGSLDSKTGADALTEGLKNLGISGDAHDDIRQQLNKYYPNGKMTIKDKNGIDMQVGVPVKAVLEAIGASEGNPFERIVPFWSRRGDDAHNRLKVLLDKPEFQAELANTLELLNMDPAAASRKAIKDAAKPK